jgi:hypothetical protein
LQITTRSGASKPAKKLGSLSIALFVARIEELILFPPRGCVSHHFYTQVRPAFGRRIGGIVLANRENVQQLVSDRNGFFN